jgi:diguanylate cyclase (GGDEF)-like protein/PAS domain S-box-containing protein
MFGAGAGVLILGALIALWVLRNTSRTELLLLLEKSSSVATLRSLGEGVIRTDVRGRISYINSVASSLTGRTLREANGRRLPDVFKLLDAGGRRLHDNPALIAIDQDRGIESSGQLTLESSTGDQSPIEYTVTPIRDQAHRASGAVLVFRNLTEIRRMANQLAYQATHDPLTGLVNRYEFERRMEAALDSARDQKRRHTLLYLDLDQFQVINNISGHLAGDELLKRIAARLHDNTCKTDTLARLGGDEFGVLLIDCAPGEALPIAHALRREVTGLKFSWDGKPFDISVSIGMVEVSSRSGSSAELLSAADNACYLAKDLGRNRIQLYKLDDAAVLRRQGEMRWLPRIRAALEHDHFRLFHQRIVSLAPSFHEQHCEILLRLVDGGDEKVVLPGAFIPAAERYNLMHEIDRWVITAAFQFLASHPDYLSDPRQLWTINLSGQTICDAEFLSFVVSRFREHAIPPDRICFEITETTAVRNLTQASELMRALRAMGCRFALDDFGSGLSSFNYLKHLKADFLKIDGSFIRDMLTDSTDCAMVESINQIGQLMGLRTIAEFVENEDILLRLRALRVDFAQGTGVHMPQPLAAWRHRDAMPA